VAEVTVDETPPRYSLQKPNFGRKCTMAEGEQKNWRELCNAAREATDPDEVLKILEELDKALKREGQVQRDFRSRIPGAACVATRWGISTTLRSSLTVREEVCVPRFTALYEGHCASPCAWRVVALFGRYCHIAMSKNPCLSSFW